MNKQDEARMKALEHKVKELQDIIFDRPTIPNGRIDDYEAGLIHRIAVLESEVKRKADVTW